MTHKLIPILILSILGFTCSAQHAGIPPPGPISLGLGGISSNLLNSWAGFNNPAGLTSQTQMSVLAGYQTSVNFSPFNTVTAAVTIPTALGVVAFNTYKFGDELFSNQMVALSFAKKIGIMSLGLKAGLVQYNVQGFGKRSVFTADMGGIANLTPTISFGMHICNFTQSVIAAESQEKIPTVIRLAIDYHPSDQLNLYIEGEKEIILAPDLKFGLSCQLNEAVVVRTGFSTITARHSFGGSLRIKSFIVDYGLRANRNIGATHSFGLTYIFNE